MSGWRRRVHDALGISGLSSDLHDVTRRLAEVEEHATTALDREDRTVRELAVDLTERIAALEQRLAALEARVLDR